MLEAFSVEVDGFQIVPPAFGDSTIYSLLEGLSGLQTQANTGRMRSHGKRNLLRDCPAVARLARSQTLKELLHPVLGPAAFPVRGLFFDKQAGANWQVGWHQDLSIAVAERMEVPGFNGWSMKQGVTHVQPPASVMENMLTVRVHLDDCGEDDGPLRVLRGSHRQGRLTDEQVAQWQRSGNEVTCLLPRGGVLLMRPLLLHASSPAKNPRHRRVVHLEYAANPLPSGLLWFEQTV